MFFFSSRPFSTGALLFVGLSANCTGNLGSTASRSLIVHKVVITRKIKQLQNICKNVLLPARRYASAGLCDSDVSVCPSHAGIVPSRAKAGS